MMNIEITITKDGEQYLTTKEQSYTVARFTKLIDDLKERFPEDEGFKITAVGRDSVVKEIRI